MDIFKFTNPTSKTKMECGMIINGLKSKLWIERYRDAGEFTLVSLAESDIHKQLSIGSFISHTNTTEIMIVENHEISDSRGKESELVITGRSFETVLESRIVAINRTFPHTNAAGLNDNYLIGTYPIWQAAIVLGQTHTYATSLPNDDDAIPWVVFSLVGTSPGGTSAPRVVQRGTVYERFLELCTIDNLGIRIIRPGTWNPLLGALAPNTVITVHKGVDRTAQIVRSYDSGEIESIDYLWSNKLLRNAALVSGKWVEIMVYTAAKEYDRRMLLVSAKDIDEDFPAVPTGTDLTNVIAAMQQRGLEAIAYKNDLGITKAQLQKEISKYEYRKDYNVGDLVTVTGDYNEVSTMRISEYVEIEDETGESGYPTLSME